MYISSLSSIPHEDKQLVDVQVYRGMQKKQNDSHTLKNEMKSNLNLKKLFLKRVYKDCHYLSWYFILGSSFYLAHSEASHSTL